MLAGSQIREYLEPGEEEMLKNAIPSPIAAEGGVLGYGNTGHRNAADRKKSCDFFRAEVALLP